MKEKVFKFDDESSLRVIIEDGYVMTFVLQARHIGEEVRTTSASVKLNSEEVIELVNWIGEELTEEDCSNGE